MQARAQQDQLRDKIQQVDWTNGVAHTHQVTARCPSCRNDTGGGKYCQHCGTPLAAAAEADVFCAQCGTRLAPTALFCTGCGSGTH
jgi:predicted amidophosphoribosyltransferase